MAVYSKTFLEMQTELNYLLMNDSDHATWTLARKKDFLNRANNELLALWNEEGDADIKQTTITTSDGTQEYNLPSDFLYTKHGMVYDQEDYTELFPMDYSQSYYRGEDDQTGEPAQFYIKGYYGKIGDTTTYPKIGFFPVPDGAYTYVVNYIPISADQMSADGDISGVPATFHDLVVLRAAIMAAQQQGYVDLASTFLPEHEKRMREYKEMIRSRIRPNRVEFCSAF